MDAHQQIDEIVKGNRVVLFMKGTRSFPQCGFSARAVEIFKRCGVTFKDVNVLADPTVRQGIKDYSNWPTIPQAYIDGQFVGGSDILFEMFENGELQKLLGVEAAAKAASEAPVAAPSITVSDRAAQAFKAALADMGSDVLRFDVSPSFQYDLFFGPKSDDDLVVATAGLSIHVSKSSAARANGSRIDYVEGEGGTGFKIENPQEPARVKALAPSELKALLDQKKDVYLFDTRGDSERTVAAIAQARPLDQAGQELLASLPRDAFIVLHCHHGIRSRGAAEELLKRGYTNVHNLTGGIDAWSVGVDTSVPRY
jgi:monothiol glutaredoxin